MTSPPRQRRDRSRRRLAHAEASEIVLHARTLFCSQPHGDTGASLEPITRSDLVLIARAVRSGWDVPETKRVEIIQQIGLALASDDPRLALSAARAMMAMIDERTG